MISEKLVCSHRLLTYFPGSWWGRSHVIALMVTRFASDTEFDISKDELECALMRRLEERSEVAFTCFY